MTKTAALFPGQGSQYTGMGRKLTDNETLADKFSLADEMLGYSLSTLMFEGPDEKLRQTEYTQPAIFLHSILLFEQSGLKPDMVAGHSLGEYSAVVAAGVMDLESGLELVSLRGRLMQQAGENKPGAMAAVIGLEDRIVEEVCFEASESSGEKVVPANYNCPGQLVISGEPTAVDLAMEKAKERGCRMAKRLPVSGAFHSPLMSAARDGLKGKLEETAFSSPTCPVYSNTTAEAVTDPEQIRANLLEQLLSPVLWTQTLNAMRNDGAERFVECGPGKVLQGLVKRTLRDVTIEGTDE
ncbi:MAG: ACP S-malonyltransferase [Balneolaceae bacterium]